MKRKIIDFIAGRIGLQRFFELMYSASLYGMNYGKGGNIKNSGELSAIKYVKRKLGNQDKALILFDVGANRGNYSIALAENFSGIDFRIHSFEPSVHIFQELMKTIGANNNISPSNIGFGETTESMKLFSRGYLSLSGLTSVYQRRLDHYGIELSHNETIQLKRIDEYCREKNIERINFLKLDVEGHEHKCLIGAGDMLKSKKIDFIQFEFGGCNIDSRTYFQDFWYLLKDDYDFYRIVKNGLAPIKKYNERLEVFKNINFLAELKK